MRNLGLLILSFGVLIGCAPFEIVGQNGAQPSELVDQFNNVLGDQNVSPLLSTYRPLNSQEHERSLSAILSMNVDTQLTFGSTGNGYWTSQDSSFDQGTLDLLLVKTLDILEQYLSDTANDEFSCVSSLNVSCVSQIIETLGQRAFRRSLSAAELSDFVQFYESLTSDGEETALRMTLARLLMSPQFLYKREIGLAAQQGYRVLSDIEKVSFVSYAMTGAPPNRELIKKAEQGSLALDELGQIASDLLDTENGKTWILSFFKQFLRVQKLDQYREQPDQFKKLSDREEGEALAQEFDEFVTEVLINQNQSIQALFSQSRIPVSRETAGIYDVDLNGQDKAWVETNRLGILNLSSVLSVHSSDTEQDRDQPVSRATLVSDQVLCREILIPSGVDLDAAEMNAMDDNSEFDELTTREQFEAIMQQGADCIQCHAQFMPFGYLFSNFDGLGAYRDEQRNRNINAEAQAILDGNPKVYKDSNEFVNDLVNSSEFQSCVVEQWLRFATGFNEEAVISKVGETLQSTSTLSFKEQIKVIFSNPALYVRKGE